MPSRRYPHPKDAATTRVMRANPRRDTSPEVRLRSHLHRAGLRFRKDLQLRIGASLTRPDIVFPKQRLAVFVDGCFWHGCPRHATQPKHNAWYWAPKLARNRERDRERTHALRRGGWIVRRFWEHDDPAVVAQRLAALVARLRG